MLFFLIITSEAYLKSCPTSKMFDRVLVMSLYLLCLFTPKLSESILTKRKNRPIYIFFYVFLHCLKKAYERLFK